MFLSPYLLSLLPRPPPSLPPPPNLPLCLSPLVWTLEHEEEDISLQPAKDPTIVTQISRTKSKHLVGIILIISYTHCNEYMCTVMYVLFNLQYNIAHFGCPFQFDLVYGHPEPEEGTCTCIHNYKYMIIHVVS